MAAWMVVQRVVGKAAVRGKSLAVMMVAKRVVMSVGTTGHVMVDVMVERTAAWLVHEWVEWTGV